VNSPLTSQLSATAAESWAEMERRARERRSFRFPTSARSQILAPSVPFTSSHAFTPSANGSPGRVCPQRPSGGQASGRRQLITRSKRSSPGLGAGISVREVGITPQAIAASWAANQAANGPIRHYAPARDLLRCRSTARGSRTLQASEIPTFPGQGLERACLQRLRLWPPRRRRSGPQLPGP